MPGWPQVLFSVLSHACVVPRLRLCAGGPVTLFKGGAGVVMNYSAAVFNQNTLLYIKQGQLPVSPAPLPAPIPSPPPPAGEGSSLSGGAIAGIVVGAACGVAVVAAVAALLLVKRRRGQETRQQEQKLAVCKVRLVQGRGQQRGGRVSLLAVYARRLVA